MMIHPSDDATIVRDSSVAARRPQHRAAVGGRPLSAIGAPTLVIHGSADPMFPLRHGQAQAGEIPWARLLPLPGAGHGSTEPIGTR
jgi:pimeloyl-ACP methyl ester carboxylesterase